MAKRIKAEQFEVDDAEAAMARFKVGLAKLVRVPKSEIKAKRKRTKPATNRKA
jgi:hypothetical protein